MRLVVALVIVCVPERTRLRAASIRHQTAALRVECITSRDQARAVVRGARQQDSCQRTLVARVGLTVAIVVVGVPSRARLSACAVGINVVTLGTIAGTSRHQFGAAVRCINTSHESPCSIKHEGSHVPTQVKGVPANVPAEHV